MIIDYLVPLLIEYYFGAKREATKEATKVLMEKRKFMTERELLEEFKRTPRKIS
jgi:hypothetical protein